MGIVISFGSLKGGVGKTTTAVISAWVLSQEKRILLVDMDSQGNATTMATQKQPYEFSDQTVLEAIKAGDPRQYIYQVSEKLHLLPSDAMLATLGQYMYREYKGADPFFLLRDTLSVVKNEYDFIIIDLPPNLGEHTSVSLIASNYAIAVLQAEPFALNSLEQYLEFMQIVQEKKNPNIRLAGILAGMIDAKATIDGSVLAKVREDFGEAVFNTVINRKAKIKEFSLTGISRSTQQGRVAIKMYDDFVKELLSRV